MGDMTLALNDPLNKGQDHSFWYQSMASYRLSSVNSNICSMTHHLSTLYSNRRQTDATL